MGKIEYSGECLCGGKILTAFKKPTRFQHSIAKALCQGCQSEFMLYCYLEYNDGVRAYMPSHEVVTATKKLRDAVMVKQEALLAEKKFKESTPPL
jgi:hypothetical protein